MISMTTEKVKRKLTTILCADVKGYSRLMGEDEELTLRTLNTYKEVIGSLIPQHQGRVISSAGDSVLAEFASVVDAVQCAVEIQQVLKAKNAVLPETRRMEFRIGINLGDVIEEGDSIYGDGVNIAARLESLAEAGGICLSESAFQQIENKIPLKYEYLGEHQVKNIVKPIRVYKAQIETEVASLEKMAFPLPDLPSIAVLPFVNMSDDPKQEFLCDGLTEEIITALSKVSRLFVIARTSTFTYKGKPVKVKLVSEELGVRYVLEGSIQRSGDRIRVTVQLIDALNGYHLWAERYDRDLKDLFALQDEVTLKILKALQVKITSGEQSHLTQKWNCSENLECYLKYLEAQKCLDQGTIEGNNMARRKAEETLALCPGHT
jgi:adenylate cyclase